MDAKTEQTNEPTTEQLRAMLNEIISTNEKYVERLAHQDDLDAMAQIIISLMEEKI